VLNVSSDFRKNFWTTRSKSLITPAVPPTEGRIAIVTNAGWDAVDARASSRAWHVDERRNRVRRSRVVLTHQGWRQVGDDALSFLAHHAGDGGTAWPPGRARYTSSNHCAGKAGMLPLYLYAHVHLSLRYNAHETAGAARTRFSLRLLLRVACALSRGGNDLQASGALCRENVGVWFTVIARSQAAKSRRMG
jgi:hypothetical protein